MGTENIPDERVAWYRQGRLLAAAGVLVLLTGLWLAACVIEVHVIRLSDSPAGRRAGSGSIVIAEYGCLRFGEIQGMMPVPSEKTWVGWGERPGMRMWAGPETDHGPLEMEFLPERGQWRMLWVTNYTGIPLWGLPAGWLGLWWWRAARRKRVGE